MKKKLFAIIFVVLVCIAIAAPCFASEARCIDNAERLTESELQSVIAKLDEVSEKHNVDVCVLTTDSVYGESVETYADNFYEQSDWGQGENRDGIMLMISMEDRDWYISTCGYGITAVTDYGIKYIGQGIVSELSDGDYEGAFKHYAELCDELLTKAENGTPYDVGSEKKNGFNPLGALVSLFMGVITAMFPTMVMKNDLKSVGNQVRASSYIKQGSLNLTSKNDTFLYRNLTSIPIPRDENKGGSSTHMSAGGMTHGGGGGKF